MNPEEAQRVLATERKLATAQKSEDAVKLLLLIGVVVALFFIALEVVDSPRFRSWVSGFTSSSSR